jgi:hypothetical protein
MGHQDTLQLRKGPIGFIYNLRDIYSSKIKVDLCIKISFEGGNLISLREMILVWFSSNREH